jgi:membrane-associated phospholipid phosphatase
MAAITVRPTTTDIAIAKTIAKNTNVPVEKLAGVLTWGADEHVSRVLIATWWLCKRVQDRTARRAADHVLLTTLVAFAIPHVVKSIFNQERPDRGTISGHWRSVPFSGKPLDSFPSGHAVHVGALASAASRLPKPKIHIAWLVGAVSSQRQSSCLRIGQATFLSGLRLAPSQYVRYVH